MDVTQTVASYLGTAGGAAVLVALISGIFKQLSGASGRERAKNTSLEEQRRNAVVERDEANDRADDEFNKRRIREQALARANLLLTQNGITPEAWPDLEQTLTAEQLKELRKQ
ncbi:hypothetical protein [Frigoribacterium sp. CG_9.8]|uniref:hypothetical protein n=1 Tax=Frigoribacterium sp. CG_9.8 TaxID=2787733 RepID=UPI0018C9D6B1|nr:hypothetical protein [Frigoribacterium sp. CG_9.8]MBG6106627.1 hypothetical protein [Frigoribacterium sp. CG_9.8]